MNRKPSWLLVPHRENKNREYVQGLLAGLGLNTVCQEALCPNQAECYENKTTTFMILGVNCTRNCRFCNVKHQPPEPVDTDESAHIAFATEKLGLAYVVITSVTRDDLSDGGASQFAATIKAVKKHCPTTAVEVLIPDLNGNLEALSIITSIAPDVISHNLETVPDLYQNVRPEANYRRSLMLLDAIKEQNSQIHSKSSLMLGFGEKKEQVLRVMDDLRKVDCDFLTLGQYLAPSKKHIAVQEYIHPDIFDWYKEIAYAKGFKHVASGPLVRSSYRAGKAIIP